MLSMPILWKHDKMLHVMLQQQQQQPMNTSFATQNETILSSAIPTLHHYNISKTISITSDDGIITSNNSTLPTTKTIIILADPSEPIFHIQSEGHEMFNPGPFMSKSDNSKSQEPTTRLTSSNSGTSYNFAIFQPSLSSQKVIWKSF